MATTRDKHGCTTITLDERNNRPGSITVDGDLTDEGLVVIMHFQLESEPAEYVRTVADPADFGSFQVTFKGEASFSGSCQLTAQQGKDLVDAIQHQLRPGP
jgi:hypothetical protein